MSHEDSNDGQVARRFGKHEILQVTRAQERQAVEREHVSRERSFTKRGAWELVEEGKDLAEEGSQHRPGRGRRRGVAAERSKGLLRSQGRERGS